MTEFIAGEKERSRLALEAARVVVNIDPNSAANRLILTGELPTSIGKDFDFLMDMRDSGDYGGLIHVSLSDAQAAIETADRILSTIIPLC